MNNIASRFRFGKTAVALAALLCLTQPSWAQSSEKSFADMVRKFVLVPVGAPESEMLAKATAAVKFMQRMELPEASLAANEALQLDPRNAHLHFLNGFIYHLQARQGDSQKNEMAVEGYQQALRIDPGNWIVQEFLGQAYLDQGRFDDAKAQFSEVLLMTPESAVSIYGLMVASYLTGDPATACVMADQFKKVSTEPNAGFNRSSVSVYAACGEFAKADVMREQMRLQNGGRGDVERVDRRLAQWKSFYRKQEQASEPAGGNPAPGFLKTSLKSGVADVSPVLLAQAFKPPTVKAPAAAPAGPAPAAFDQPTPKPASVADSSSDGSPRMVLVDVVLVSTQELVSTSKGINLLNALTLQLGSVAGNLAAYSRVNSSNQANNAAANVSTAITRAVTVPALAYSLNIANANNATNEVLARPTLAAMEGLPSEFFSGTNLSAGVVSTSMQGGTTVVPLDKRFGIKLAVTPAFLVNGRVQLKVEAQRTSLNTTTDNPKVAYQIEIAEITANANVVMNLGDTLVLSGLSEKSTAHTRDGVPVLQDIPLAQYFFSNKKTNDIQRSVLILITPRLPAYTAKADPNQSAATSDSVNALRKQFGIAGRGLSNTEAVLSHLKANEIFREFRQGDVAVAQWDHMYSTGDRLRQALEFLYY